MITHMKYIKRFKSKYLFIGGINIRIRQHFGYLRGRKLAIRKRFIVRKKRSNVRKVSFSSLEYSYQLKKKKKCILRILNQFVLVYVIRLL